MVGCIYETITFSKTMYFYFFNILMVAKHMISKFYVCQLFKNHNVLAVLKKNTCPLIDHLFFKVKIAELSSIVG